MSEALRRLTGTALVLGAFFLYAIMAFWSVRVVQGPRYDGPHRFPALSPPQLMALVVAVAMPVLLVRRWPVVVYGVILAETVLAAEFGARSWVLFAAATAAIGYLALVRSMMVSVGSAGAMVTVWFLENVLVLPKDMAPNLGSTTAQMALYAACGWGLGYVIRKRREYTVSLREQSAARAVMAERLRIARELHDSVAHSIGIITVLSGAAARVVETKPEQARQALTGIETTSRETLLELQRMLGALRPRRAGRRHAAGRSAGAGRAAWPTSRSSPNARPTPGCGST